MIAVLPWLEAMAYGATIVGAIGVLFAVWQLVEVRRQRVRQFEDLYIQRYWAIMDALSPAATIAAFASSSRSASAVETNFSAVDEKAALAYLVLCEDEAGARAENLVADHTWSMWRAFICSQVEREPFASVWWKIAPEGEQSDRFEHLSAMLASADARTNYEPCQLSKFRRKLHGLT